MLLKISKTMQAIIMPGEQDGQPYAGLSGADTVRALIRAQYVAEKGIAKDGSVKIDVSEAEANMLREHAAVQRMDLEQRLEQCATDDEKKPFFGRLSAWGAVERAIKKEEEANRVY